MPVKVVVDTNVWVSYFINERINYLVKWFLDHEIEVLISDELMDEIEEVLLRPKLAGKKSAEDVSDFLHLLGDLGSFHKVKMIFKDSPDAKDNFLFDLCLAANADYLITSDKRLLNFVPDLNLKIISFSEFRKSYFRNT